ncbi:MAG: hypothetical protein H6658_10325 [Ardenticatenaceae bacterium]|nr:hypothetical protein [Ardenticatenaceae bacterium]
MTNVYRYLCYPLLFLGILLTTACTPALILPTVIPLAAVPTGSAGETAVDPLLPPTFTPAASLTPLPPGKVGPAPTRPDPSITPTLPTSTPRPTHTPTPSITPTPKPIEPQTVPQSPQVIHYNQSRLGIHVVRNNSADIMNFVRNAQPAVMKSVDDLGFMTEVKEASPTTVTVGRVDDIFIQNYIGEPEEAAREYVNKHLRTYWLNPGVDYWEGWNEPDPGMERMAWYARFEQERVKLMAQHGLRSAIGGFPPGVPEVEEFRLFVPAVETAIRYGGIMTLHEGDVETGDMQFLYGSALPGYPYYPDRGAMSFRYRWFYREILEPAGLAIPLVISELEFAGWDTTTVDNLIYNQLAWYDAEARKDPYVIGFAVFTAGANNHWQNYDLNFILPQLTGYVNSQN